VLSELFHEQCSRWGDISRDHLRRVSSIVDNFVRAALDHVIVDEQVRINVKRRVQQSLDAGLQKARRELCALLSDEEAHPITYNHYYTDNIQHARADAAKKSLQISMDHAITNEWKGKLHVSNTQVDLEKLFSSLKNRVNVDMIEQACEESLADLNAYYKVGLSADAIAICTNHNQVAMKTFVDNVCRQVVERHIINNLVKAFDPVCVGALSDDELFKTAAESYPIRVRRNELQAMKTAVEESIQELRD
jgi:hypothetical protein